MAHVKNNSVEVAGQGPFTPHNSIWLAANPTAGDTLTIGSDIYEFRATATAISNDTYIGVLISAAVADTRLNLIAAMHGVGTGIADGILAVGGGGPLLVENGTENVFSMIVNVSYLMVFQAVSPGGALNPGDGVNLAFADSLTTGFTWVTSNLSNCRGFQGGPRQYIMFSQKISAQAITNGDFAFKLPWIPSSASQTLVTFLDTNNVRVVRDDDISFAGDNTLQILFNQGVAPNIQPNDTVQITVWQ